MVPSKPPPPHKMPNIIGQPKAVIKCAPRSPQWLTPKPPLPRCIQNIMVSTDTPFKAPPTATLPTVVDEATGMPIDHPITDDTIIPHKVRGLAERAVEQLGVTILATTMFDRMPPPTVSFQGPGDVIAANLRMQEDINLDIDTKEHTSGR